MKRYMFILLFSILSPLLQASDMPLHGNWCGPGHPKDLEARLNGSLPLPINEIDEACKAHDFAYVGREPWGNSQADGNLSESMTKILNKGEMWKYDPKPGLNSSEADDFQRLNDAHLSEKEFLAAAAILAYMERQQYINLYSDVTNGKISSILKIGTSSMVIATAPIGITTKLLSKLENELDGPEGAAIEASIIAGELAVKYTVEVSELLDKGIDEIGDVSELIVEKLGDKTGLDKPVKEIKGEVVLLITHPKKAVEKAGEKVVHAVDHTVTEATEEVVHAVKHPVESVKKVYNKAKKKIKKLLGL